MQKDLEHILTSSFQEYIKSSRNNFIVINANNSISKSSKSLDLIINNLKINNFKDINLFIKKQSSTLNLDGVLIVKAETIPQRKNKILKKYPKFIRELIYLFDFILNRVFPKLMLTSRIYYFFKTNINHALSKTEILGRLYYNGFVYIDEVFIDNHTYFIVKKKNNRKFNKQIFYGLFIKLERIGLNNKIIKVYKLRTMYPYAEYIQDYVYSTLGSKTGDKANNDFRVTNWGRILRKYWIDELPMILNFAKNELKLIGVRPLSNVKFSLYPDEMQIMRSRVKPGLIPPYYADLPKDFQELVDSEKKYLDSYSKRAVTTDIKYFIKVLKNILFKGARSV